MFAFHIDVPPGASELQIKLDFLATAAASGFSAGASTSANLALLSWASRVDAAGSDAHALASLQSEAEALYPALSEDFDLAEKLIRSHKSPILCQRLRVRWRRSLKNEQLAIGN